MKSTIIIGAGVAALAIFAGDVYAQANSTLLHDGNNAGRVRKYQNGEDRGADQYYAGIEQASVQQLADGTVMVVGMSSYTNIDNRVQAGQNGQGIRGEMQALCISGTIGADGAFTVNPALVNANGTVGRHVTNNDGDRYRNANHPKMFPAFNGTAMAVLYNYADNNNDQAERMLMVVDSQCNVLTNAQGGDADNSGSYQVFGNRQANGNNQGNDDFCETDDESVSIVSDLSLIHI